MSQGRSRGKAKGVEEFRPYVTRALPIGAQIACADNSGAKILEIITVHKIKTRVSRLPAAAVGDFVNVVVKKGPAELRKQVHGAVTFIADVSCHFATLSCVLYAIRTPSMMHFDSPSLNSQLEPVLGYIFTPDCVFRYNMFLLSRTMVPEIPRICELHDLCMPTCSPVNSCACRFSGVIIDLLPLLAL